MVAAVTSDLGISVAQLRTDLASGQTLAQIAAANGRPVNGLEQTIAGAVRSRFDQAVAAGKLSSSTEQALLARLSPRLDKLMTVSHPVAKVRSPRPVCDLRRLAAGYLGVTPQTLRSDLASGQTLAQIAAANGKSVSGLAQAIESAAKTRLDKAVANGRITTAREQRLLAELQTRLDLAVDRSLHSSEPAGRPQANSTVAAKSWPVTSPPSGLRGSRRLPYPSRHPVADNGESRRRRSRPRTNGPWRRSMKEPPARCSSCGSALRRRPPILRALR